TDWTLIRCPLGTRGCRSPAGGNAHWRNPAASDRCTSRLSQPAILTAPGKRTSGTSAAAGEEIPRASCCGAHSCAGASAVATPPRRLRPIRPRDDGAFGVMRGQRRRYPNCEVPGAPASSPAPQVILSQRLEELFQGPPSRDLRARGEESHRSV